MRSPAELLQPDARWRSVLAGEVGVAPPAFEGTAGIAIEDGVAALAIGSSDGTVVAVSDGRADVSGSSAQRAIDVLAPARLEWTDGLVPLGSTTDWSARAPLAVARIVVGGVAIATLTACPLSASASTLSAVVAAQTGVPAFAILGAPPSDELVEARGTAIGHATLAALDALPPAGHELYLDRVVESGAPLAVWRPRPAGAGETALVATVDAVRFGAVIVRLDSAGHCTAVELPSGPYAR